MTGSIWPLVAALLGLLLVVAVLVWQRGRHRRAMDRLMDMLDDAIDGTFRVQIYDESLFSAVESKLGDFLSASLLSARDLQVEKDKIKALISDISHQTKTPVANILLYADLLAEQELTQDGRSCAKALHSQAEKLRFLIDALVKLSRLETGIVSLNPRRGPVGPMLAELQAQFQPWAEVRGVALRFDPTDAEAVFDPKWTAEALANLVDNAVKYTPAGGEVRVGITCYDLFCRVDVEDTGVGIPKGDLNRVFARFYRAPAAAQEEGVGIGLYLARQILTEQGGYIKVQSDEGVGSRFSAFLPMAR